MKRLGSQGSQRMASVEVHVPCLIPCSSRKLIASFSGVQWHQFFSLAPTKMVQAQKRVPFFSRVTEQLRFNTPGSDHYTPVSRLPRDHFDRSVQTKNGQLERRGKEGYS